MSNTIHSDKILHFWAKDIKTYNFHAKASHEKVVSETSDLYFRCLTLFILKKTTKGLKVLGLKCVIS